VIDYGDFADPVKCPECGTEYTDRKTVEYIRKHCVCPDCPDPELEEWE
jgi:peptide subunit release factor 1 (eRF1)